MVPEFPRRLAAAPPADSRRRPATAPPRRDRRAAWAASWAVGDALARWWLMYGSKGHGLRGGSFTASGEYLAYTPIRPAAARVRFVRRPGGQRNGRHVEPARRHRQRAAAAERRAAPGMLRIGWSTRARRAVASMRGELGGRVVRLRTPAP